MGATTINCEVIVGQTGGHFNPAITFTFYLLGKVEFVGAKREIVPELRCSGRRFVTARGCSNVSGLGWKRESASRASCTTRFFKESKVYCCASIQRHLSSAKMSLRGEFLKKL